MTSNPTELKKIWVFALGSRGDIQPYVAVAHGLVEKGYKVTFFCNGRSFVSFAESFGCKGVAMGERDVDALMKSSPQMMEAMMTGSIMTFFKGMNKESQKVVPAYCDAFVKEIENEGQPDLCLTMPLSQYFGWYLAIRHKVPYLFLSTIAVIFNPEQPPFGIPKLPFGLSYYLFHNVLISAIFENYRAYDKCLNADILEKYPLASFMANMRKPEFPIVILTSFEIANILGGGSEKLAHPLTRIVGSTIIKRELQLEKIDRFGGQQDFKRLQGFMDGGEKPVYLGWGSMICRSSDFMVKYCARAAFRSGYRAIVLGGFAGLSMELLEWSDVEPVVLEYAKKNILFVQQAPHEWLFPRVRVIVHHGGAGTTTAALRAGVPSIITPVFADQWDFSYFLRKSGVGVGFDKQFQKVTSDELGDAIVRCACDFEMIKRAFELGDKLRSEDGVTRATEEVELFWRNVCVSGKFHDRFPGKTKPIKSTQRLWFRSCLVVGIVTALAVLVASCRSDH
ncbi:hypothetical protein MPSEU_000257000 [Mayamaea pseudoterrestris]|nr:hypothetical protein MPSEU_000257000 [Mayamaea pseudoterrestris]